MSPTQSRGIAGECRYCEGDWPGIAAASVSGLFAGIDPLDDEAILCHAGATLHGQRDQRWLLSLFTDPIVAGPNDERFTNGRHRVHAMRASGAQRVVVYTKAGEQS